KRSWRPTHPKKNASVHQAHALPSRRPNRLTTITATAPPTMFTPPTDPRVWRKAAAPVPAAPIPCCEKPSVPTPVHHGFEGRAALTHVVRMMSRPASSGATPAAAANFQALLGTRPAVSAGGAF